MKRNKINKIQSYAYDILNKKISRRDFLKMTAIGAGSIAAGLYGLKFLKFNERKAQVFSDDAPTEL